jgi:chemotaxis signal transduction protein
MTVTGTQVIKEKKEKIDIQEKECLSRRFCSFYLADRLYGVEITMVKEVNDEFRMTRIFHAPDEIRGYVNIRGQIFLVLDLRYLMGLEKKENIERSKLLLFKTELMECCAVLVDEVGDVVEVCSDNIEDRRKGRIDKKTPLERRKDRSQLGAGVCKLENNLMVIIDPRNMLHYVEDKVSNRE